MTIFYQSIKCASILWRKKWFLKCNTKQEKSQVLKTNSEVNTIFFRNEKKIISSHCNFNKIKCMKWWTFQVYSTVKIDDCNSRWAWHLCASMCALAFDIFERNSLLQKSTVHKWYHSLVLSLYLIPKIIIIHGWVIY